MPRDLAPVSGVDGAPAPATSPAASPAPVHQAGRPEYPPRAETAAREPYPPNDWRSTLMPPAQAPTQARPELANGASPQYHQWARGQNLTAGGTVYSGGNDLHQRTSQMPAAGPAGMEVSGSLTGHILAQGENDGPTPKSRTARVVIVMLVVMGLLVLTGVLLATFASDTVSGIFDNLINS
jgi:hypothetical protein